MRTICIANHKGGCGKTTTAINLGACLAERGFKTVLMDLDPQGHATVGLNVPHRPTTAWERLLRGHSPAKMLQPVLPGLDLVPSGFGATEDNGSSPSLQDREQALKRFLTGLRQTRPDTDFVLVDCPPSVGALTHAILWAVDEVLLTVEVSFFSLHGVGRILSSIQAVDQRKQNPTRIRVLATMYDRRTRFAKEILKNINAYFKNALYDSVIRNCVRLREASSHGVPITVYGRRTNGYRDYMNLAAEMAREVVSEKRERSEAVESAHVVGSALR